MALVFEHGLLRGAPRSHRMPPPVAFAATVARYFECVDGAIRRVWNCLSPWSRATSLRNMRIVQSSSASAQYAAGPCTGQTGVIAIMDALDAVLPEGTRVHLYGLKGGAGATWLSFAARQSGAHSTCVPVAMVEWHARRDSIRSEAATHPRCIFRAARSRSTRWPRTL